MNDYYVSPEKQMLLVALEYLFCEKGLDLLDPFALIQVMEY